MLSNPSNTLTFSVGVFKNGSLQARSTMKKLALSGALLLLAAALAQSQEVSFKLTGGMCRINGNDYNSGVTLVAEACYRHGKISALKGNWSDLGSSDAGPISSTSSDYYMWTYNYVVKTGTYQLFGFIDNNGPAGNAVSGARKAGLDLSGLTALAGLKISF